MAGLPQPLHVILLAACLGSAAARAQIPAPPAPITPTAATVTPAATEPLSPKLAKLFAGTPPKFDPSKTAAATPASPNLTADAPRNGIIRLPTYVVRDQARLPDEYQLLTPKGRDAAMAQRYMGPQGDLDGALNSFTLAGLWKSIPLLGKIPFVPFDSKTYNERAASIYERPELKRRFNELMNVEQTARELEQVAPVDKPAK